MLELGEKVQRVTTKSSALLLLFAACVELGAKFFPGLEVASRKIFGQESARPGGGRGENTDLTALNHRGGSGLPTGDATFVPTVTAELLLQSVVGPRQVGNLITVKEPRPVAARDLDEMDDGLFQLPGLLPMARHGAEKAGKAFPNVFAGGLLRIVQNLRRFVDPSESNSYTRPQRSRFAQSTINQVLQAREFFREPLFSATRSRLVEIAVRR